MGCYVLNILLSSPSRTVFLSCCLWCIVPSPLVQALCFTRQHYRRTVPSGVDNNIIIERTNKQTKAKNNNTAQKSKKIRYKNRDYGNTDNQIDQLIKRLFMDANRHIQQYFAQIYQVCDNIKGKTKYTTLSENNKIKSIV